MRRWLTALVVAGLAGSAVAGAAPAASAASTTCLVVDTNANLSYMSLQDAVNAAAAGDTLFVKGTCTGGTGIDKDLTISGQSASGTKTATLNGGGQTSVLGIGNGVSVTLNTLVITNGFAIRGGGGIINAGTVTLNGSTVTGNTASSLEDPLVGGGGILNDGGAVTLNDSAVSGNTSFVVGGGISNSVFGTVTMNGGSTVTGNTAHFGGGIFNRCGSTLVGAVAGVNVFNNTPDDIFNGSC